MEADSDEQVKVVGSTVEGVRVYGVYTVLCVCMSIASFTLRVQTYYHYGSGS